ncbi:hypothetical protein K457DRAFT_799095 [Linnemannia elongata AG-77]|uniref:Uncharacterized protein n=1 Tax=Linnemannia elongata AG-77 TaxID=1314771 RepID=A0A197JIS6_9FUNG|nr:hypothetical protein K457DRAFT_799095 [Linnemannia elongata AG-77]
MCILHRSIITNQVFLRTLSFFLTFFLSLSPLLPSAQLQLPAQLQIQLPFSLSLTLSLSLSPLLSNNSIPTSTPPTPPTPPPHSTPITSMCSTHTGSHLPPSQCSCCALIHSRHFSSPWPLTFSHTHTQHHHHRHYYYHNQSRFLCLQPRMTTNNRLIRRLFLTSISNPLFLDCPQHLYITNQSALTIVPTISTPF